MSSNESSVKIGIISDTHGYLDDQVFLFFQDCDELWHAGDIGSDSVIEKLEAFKPVRAVFGNIDENKIRWKYPEDQLFDCGGLKVLMTHIGGSPPRYNSRVHSIVEKEKPGIFVCGHSHILKVMKDSKHDLLFINPGSAGNQGLHHIKTVLRFNITASVPGDMEILELGKRF